MNASLLAAQLTRAREYGVPLPGAGQRVTGSDHCASRRGEDHSQLRGRRIIKSGWTEASGSSAGFLMLGHSPRLLHDQLTRRGGALSLYPLIMAQLHWNLITETAKLPRTSEVIN